MVRRRHSQLDSEAARQLFNDMVTVATCNVGILCTGSELVARVVIWQSCCVTGTCMSTTLLIEPTVLSSSCSRAPSLALLDVEDAHIDVVSSPVREAFFRAPPSSRATLPRYNNQSQNLPHP